MDDSTKLLPIDPAFAFLKKYGLDEYVPGMIIAVGKLQLLIFLSDAFTILDIANRDSSGLYPPN